MDGPEDHRVPPGSPRKPEDAEGTLHGDVPSGEVYEESLSWGGQLGYMMASLVVVYVPLLIFLEYVIGLEESREASSWGDYGLAFAAILMGVVVHSLVALYIQGALIYQYSGMCPTMPKLLQWRLRFTFARSFEQTGQGADHDAFQRTRGRPRSRQKASKPVSVTTAYAPGARFSRREFTLVVLIPTITALVLVPGALVISQMYLTEIASIGLFVIVGLSFYYLHYAIWALRQPRGTTIALTEDSSTVRAYRSPAVQR